MIENAPSFQQAKGTTNPPLRQKYLRGIHLEEAGEYMGKIIYQPSLTIRMARDNDDKFCDIGGPLTVLIGPKAFEDYETEDDFKSALIDNQGVYAKHRFNNTTWTRNSLCHCFDKKHNDRRRVLMELQATRNQLRQHLSGRRNLSETLVHEILTTLQKGGLFLRTNRRSRRGPA